MYVVIYVTAESLEQARRIARALVEERLAACVNIVGRVESVYWWEGEVQESQEALLIIKSLRSRVEEVVRRVKELHSYTVPEVVAVEICGGNPDYLRWLREECGE